MAADPAEALALRTFDYGETSQIVHLFTREQGRVHGIAKGAKRLKGAFHGGIPVLTLGDVRIYGRKKSADLRTLASYAVRSHFPGLRERLPRFHAAMHIAALLLGFLREEQPQEPLFDLSLSALRLLEEATDADAAALTSGFEAMLLVSTGFAPELAACVECGRAARNVESARLSPSRGGLLCRGCRGSDARAGTISGRAIPVLRALAEGPLVRARNLPADPALRREVREALTIWTSALLDRRLRFRGGG